MLRGVICIFVCLLVSKIVSRITQKRKMKKIPENFTRGGSWSNLDPSKCWKLCRLGSTNPGIFKRDSLTLGIFGYCNYCSFWYIGLHLESLINIKSSRV